ncbi:MAG: protein-export chaperone SecB, partial [Acetobacteraceae bacterium]|nr:protein-export chaperone SecB [Acetobacteraceae bacterium]
MSEAEPTQPQTPPLMVNAQYIKDLSFEVPNAPEVFSTLKAQPNVNINLDVQARRLQDGQDIFEVTLQIRAEAVEAPAAPNGSAGNDGKPVFIAELSFCGVFTLN